LRRDRHATYKFSMKNSGRKTVKVATQGTAGKVGKLAKVASEGVEARRSPPTHEEIAARSYALYLARGGLHGHDVEDWLLAEADLLA
jgi:Protein of unknown function (DUF2934)